MSKRISIIGGGPIGIEAALHAAHKGHEVQLYERGDIGAHVQHWGHVTFFSPWSLDRSPLGEELLTMAGHTLAPGEAFPTGAEYVEQYLKPLSEHPLLEGRVHTQHEVRGISRSHALKGDFIAQDARKQGPFLLLVKDDEGGERYEEADVVIDVTGSYRHHNALGPGGLQALGEATAAPFIERYIPDISGDHTSIYEGARTLVVGSGYSAVSSVKLLHELNAPHPEAELFWLMRSEECPYEIIEQDMLPQRSELAAFGNAAARGEVEGVRPVLGAYVRRIQVAERGLKVEIVHQGTVRELEVDRIVSNVGYRPDISLYRELQVHLCYASEGPMKLAAALLAAGGGGGDCLTQASAGAQTLLNPEPDFFVLGAKSYGRGSAFLIKLGVEQVREVLELLEA